MRSLLTGVKAEESLGFSVSWASEEENVLSSGGNLGKLIEGDTFSVGLGDPGSGLGGELECADPQSLGDLQKPVVVGDCAANSDDSAVELGDGCFDIFIGRFLEKFGDRSED